MSTARFFDTRAAYLLFATATTEKAAVAERLGRELGLIVPRPPGLHVFDAGMGDASVLSQVMREMHTVFPRVPWTVVGKEISIEDVRQALNRLPDRLFEHPEMVFVVTNMRFGEAAELAPRHDGDLVWREVPLEGDTSHDFAAQVRRLMPDLAGDWEVETSPRSGNPVYVRPAVLVLYRQDHEFLLRSLIPRRGTAAAPYDLIIAAQPYRAAASLEQKVRTVIAPLARRLASGGRLVGIHSTGRDPGMEIIRRVWPGEDPFVHRADDIAAGARRLLADPELDFDVPAGEAGRIRYEMHAMPSESSEHIGTSSVLATWNAAAYVAQIDEGRLAEAMRSGAWEAATRAVLAHHPRVWFEDELYRIVRR